MSLTMSIEPLSMSLSAIGLFGMSANLPSISRKDLVTLFDIRDNAFYLLVQKLGEQTPLIYASRKLFS